MVDFVRDLSAKTELPGTRVVSWLGIARGKFFDWRQRYGKANEHNAQVPRDHWIEMWERRAIIDYCWFARFLVIRDQVLPGLCPR